MPRQQQINFPRVAHHRPTGPYGFTANQIVNAAREGYRLYNRHRSNSAPAAAPQMPRRNHATTQTAVRKGEEKASGNDFASEMIDKYHATERFKEAGKKRKKHHHKKHLTLKQKVKKIVKSTIVNLGPRNVHMEKHAGKLDGKVFSAVWSTTLNQAVTCQGSATHTTGFFLRCWNGPADYTATTSDAPSAVDLMACIRSAGQNATNITKPGLSESEAGGPSNVATSVAATNYVMQPDLMKTAIWVSSYHYHLNIYNPQSVDVTYDIYEFQAARNMSPNDNYATVSSAWTQLLLETNVMVTNDFTTNNPEGLWGILPEDVPGLSRHWKIINRTRIKLAAADSTAIAWTGPKGWYRPEKMPNICTIKDHTTEFVILAGNGPCFGAAASASCQFTASRRIHYRYEALKGQKGIDNVTYQLLAD